MKYVAIGENHLYQKAYTRGMKAVTRTVVIYCLKDYAAARLQKAHPLGCRINRVGLTVTKKIGGAVTRNRVKRILREGLRALEKEIPLKRGYLVVLVARDAAVGAKTQDIYADLKHGFQKLGMPEGMPFPPKQERQTSGGRERTEEKKKTGNAKKAKPPKQNPPIAPRMASHDGQSGGASKEKP